MTKINNTFTVPDFDVIVKDTLKELPEPERQMVEVIFKLARVKLEIMLVKRQLPADMDEN